MQFNNLPTIALIQLLALNKDTWIEAQLVLEGGYSTHFLFWSDGALLNEGCDSQMMETTLADFLTFYKYGFWRITQFA